MNIFNPNDQNYSKDVKIVAALERVAHAFKVLQLKEGKERGLSPIQMQILMFVNFHHEKLCTVSYLAREFDLTKATISDAVRILLQKKLVQKVMDSVDSRSYYLTPTADGLKHIDELRDFGSPLLTSLQNLSEEDKENLLHSLLQIIRHLNKAGVISIQRSCHNCVFYDQQKGHFCNLLKSPLLNSEIKLDCPEFESKI